MAGKSVGELLKKRREISITVTGRRSGREFTVPVWFVADDAAVWLLPVYGSKTQWYRNLENNPAIGIQIGKERHDLTARLLKDPAGVNRVIERFRDKYSEAEIKRWYTGLDVAVQVPLASRP